jgi:hypothetical protein
LLAVLVSFEEAVDQMRRWRVGYAEPKINFEINYEPRPITLAEACTLVSRCTDVMPSWMVDAGDELDAARPKSNTT